QHPPAHPRNVARRVPAGAGSGGRRLAVVLRPDLGAYERVVERERVLGIPLVVQHQTGAHARLPLERTSLDLTVVLRRLGAPQGIEGRRGPLGIPAEVVPEAPRDVAPGTGALGQLLAVLGCVQPPGGVVLELGDAVDLALPHARGDTCLRFLPTVHGHQTGRDAVGVETARAAAEDLLA